MNLPDISKLRNFKLPSFFSVQQASIGLDIGTSALKLVVLEKKGKEKILRKASYQELSPGADLSVSLKTFFESQGITERLVNISVSGQSVIMRYIILPQMTISELKATLQFEAKQYIPFPLEEVLLDCAILNEKFEANKMLVALAAIKRAVLQERLSLVQKAGLAVRLIDVDCFCLANVFTHTMCLSQSKDGLSLKKQTIGLLNIGAHITNMAIMDNGCVRFSRDIAFGGQDATQHNLSAEINSSIDYYENQNGKPVEKMYVSGGLSLNQALQGFLSHQLNVPIVCLEVLSGIETAPGFSQDTTAPKAGVFAIALGLALR